MNDQAPDAASGAHVNEVVVHGSARGFTQEVSVNGHFFMCDEPLAQGGQDAGPSPYDLLLAALGACTSMTISMYARRKQWPLESVRVTLRHAKIHATDCAECDTKVGKLDHIERDIALIGALDRAQQERLLEMADKCPVHRTLMSEISIRTRQVSS